MTCEDSTLHNMADLCQHPVDHDHHGPHQLEPAAEEEEIGASARHNR
jgi:hypothetical protein